MFPFVRVGSLAVQPVTTKVTKGHEGHALHVPLRARRVPGGSA